MTECKANPKPLWLTATQNSVNIDSKWAFIFLNLVPETPFLGKFGPETSKCFFVNVMHVFKGDDSEFDHCFLKFHP